MVITGLGLEVAEQEVGNKALSLSYKMDNVKNLMYIILTINDNIVLYN